MKRQVLKRWLSCLLVTAMLVPLAACGSGNQTAPPSSTPASPSTESTLPEPSGSGNEKVTIRFSFDQGVGAPTQKMVDEYNASQDKVFVETVILPQDANVVHDDFVNKLASEDTSIDVMALDVVYVAEFASAGWLEDLGQYFDKSVQDQYLKGTIESATYQGKLVAFPWFTNASVLFYRKDVIEELGVDVPTTYQGWIDLNESALGRGGVEYLASFQASQSEALVCNWVEYLWNNGGDVLDASGNPIINSQNNVEATKIMLDLVKNYAPQGVTTYSEPESEQVFLDEKSLFLRNWSGFWSTANREGSKVAGKVGVTSLPIGPDGSKGHSCLGGLSLIINKFIDDTQKEAAADFVRYLSSFETQKSFTLIAAQPPVLKAVYEDPEILKEIPFYADFYGVIQEGKSRPMAPKYARVSDAIQRNVHQILSGTMEVSEGLDKLQNEVANIGM